MGLKEKVKWLRRKLPADPEVISVGWVHPVTGECSWSITYTPLPDGSGYSVTETRDGEPSRVTLAPRQ
jgi:hypothetical protein